LREALEESNLPFRVDLFAWDEVPESFKANIEKESVCLTENENFQPGERVRLVKGSSATRVAR
jgi:hypothetical protein